ncbi:hypothetical protein [Luteimicrobium album]|uniref:hypothetical protein n=1 Tax=Luteimicrobium album TaxID=1054550 RepID=UPI0024E0CCE3|nr:hypothetical protein [Luteimicrobium album]
MSAPTRPYPAGPLCARHQPDPPPVPPAGTTLADLRARRPRTSSTSTPAGGRTSGPSPTARPRPARDPP